MNDPDPAYEAAKRHAEHIAALYACHPAVTEAELTAHGFRPVSVVYGPRDAGQDTGLTGRELTALAGECGTLAATCGCGCAATTFLFTGPDADTAATRFIAAVLEIAPRGWRVTATARPVWDLD